MSLLLLLSVVIALYGSCYAFDYRLLAHYLLHEILLFYSKIPRDISNAKQTDGTWLAVFNSSSWPKLGRLFTIIAVKLRGGFVPHIFLWCARGLVTGLYIKPINGLFGMFYIQNVSDKAMHYYAFYHQHHFHSLLLCMAYWLYHNRFQIACLCAMSFTNALYFPLQMGYSVLCRAYLLFQTSMGTLEQALQLKNAGYFSYTAAFIIPKLLYLCVDLFCSLTSLLI